jgi:hypothetical protein
MLERGGMGGMNNNAKAMLERGGMGGMNNNAKAMLERGGMDGMNNNAKAMLERGGMDGMNNNAKAMLERGGMDEPDIMEEQSMDNFEDIVGEEEREAVEEEGEDTETTKKNKSKKKSNQATIEGFNGSNVIGNNLNMRVLLSILIAFIYYVFSHKQTKQMLNTLFKSIDKLLKIDGLLYNNNIVVNMVLFGIVIFIILQLY